MISIISNGQQPTGRYLTGLLWLLKGHTEKPQKQQLNKHILYYYSGIFPNKCLNGYTIKFNWK